MKLSQQNTEHFEEELKGYDNPLEKDHWSDVATRVLIRSVAIVAFLFSIVWAFKASL